METTTLFEVKHTDSYMSNHQIGYHVSDVEVISTRILHMDDIVKLQELRIVPSGQGTSLLSTVQKDYMWHHQIRVICDSGD